MFNQETSDNSNDSDFVISNLINQLVNLQENSTSESSNQIFKRDFQ